jgi:hypothetical protein
MTCPSNVRRNAFGTIDFDHYRRVAAHVRTETIRNTFHGAADALGNAAAVIVARLRRLTLVPPSRRAASSG